jgi:UV DNA damage endonuclease
LVEFAGQAREDVGLRKGGAEVIVRVGFACVTYSLDLSTNHTLRLANLGSDRFRRALARNLEDLRAILAWMEPRGLRMFRIGSSLIPFASHPSMQWDWEPMARPLLDAIGREYSAKGFRFSLHPGQYNVLNSPNPSVLERTLAELDYSCRVLELMGLDQSHKVVIHGGGLYGDPVASRSRLLRVLADLPGRILSRLVLENDERYFSFGNVVGICEESGLPPVFDFHHHQLNPSADIRRLLFRAQELWDCTPKVHLSSPAPGLRPGAHDLFVRREDLDQLLDLLPFDADLMIEAKAKEQAALGVLGMLLDR